MVKLARIFCLMEQYNSWALSVSLEKLVVPGDILGNKPAHISSGVCQNVSVSNRVLETTKVTAEVMTSLSFKCCHKPERGGCKFITFTN